MQTAQYHSIWLNPKLNGTQKICRYLTFSKFTDLVISRTLFLPFADRLNDPLEGVPYNLDRLTRHKVLAELAYNEKAGRLELARNLKENEHALARKPFMAVSCWSKFEKSECALMWQSYANLSEGIAVLSTMDRIQKSMKNKFEFPLYCDHVSYAEGFVGGSDSAVPIDVRHYFSKPPFYASECELRLVADLRPHVCKSNVWEETYAEGGLAIPIDLNVLIERIIIAPKMPPRLIRLVQGMCERAEIKASIDISSLSEQPRIS